MKNFKILNTKGAVLDKKQLEIYLEKLASDQTLKERADKMTYPIPRMLDNFSVITYTYNLLNEHIKLKIPIHPAGEWLLDNYYVIDETVKNIEKSLTLKKYRNFLGIANGTNCGFARIYVLANEIVSYTDNKIDGNVLTDLLRSYQEKKKLNMEEIWNVGVFLQISLIENIRQICERIVSSQLQKYKVENIIERLVENKSKEELKFAKLNEYKSKVKGHGEMKYPFIEYMSFKLRQFGKKGYPFFNLLEEQVNKMGIDISDVIKKEHFDIAVKKVSIGNAITSIKNIQRINFINIFEKINQVDDVLKQDPANVYSKMDYKTKIYYRNKIQEISKKTKISEIYIARKCLEMAEGKEGKRAHIGYYLIDEGRKELLNYLIGKNIKYWSNEKKMGTYIFLKIAVCLIISVLFGIYMYSETNSLTVSIITVFLVYLPIEIILMQIIQYILSKIIKPKQIPKLDLQAGIPEDAGTFVVIPTIISKPEKLEEMFKKLEVYYIANKSENIYFALLGDVTSSDKEIEEFDEQISELGVQYVNELNKKYPSQNFPKFHFIYRKRKWSSGEECYLGWERKRGLLEQFNEYILKNKNNEFRVSTIDLEKIPKIEYVITLDADTELVLNSGLELIGAAAHILNKPEVKDGIVVSGHGIIQPRVGISLDAASRTLFTKLYSGSSGTDSYTNAISDIYQDNFDEGIYTGKGIYALNVFSEVLKNEIPENTVLSHDLLEGSYLRTGLSSDIILMDGYPGNYLSFKTRLSRWTRGDWQITRWLRGKIKGKDGQYRVNPLNLLSKYKILNNLVKSTFAPVTFILLIFLSTINLVHDVKIWPFVLVAIFALTIPSVMEIVNKIIYRRDGEKSQKTFYKSISGVKASLARAVLEIGILPDKAFTMLNSICKTIYRMCKSKKHLLEWITAEEAEKNTKSDLVSYYRSMWINVFSGALLMILFYKNIWGVILGILWVITPGVMKYMGDKKDVKPAIQYLNQEEQRYLKEIGERTWEFFKSNLTEDVNYLPPDNYQEDRKNKVVYRTSSTNIGLALLAVVSSYDMGFESLKYCVDLLSKMIDTISRMQKWNGHLYNWYDIQTLEPLVPKYVSTVDSGNFVGYLYTLKQFLEDVKKELNTDKIKLYSNGDNVLQQSKMKEELTFYDKEIMLQKVDSMIKTIETLITDTDFSHLYSKENRIFYIGFNVEDNSLTPSYYDLLASEARQASLVAIAKKDVPVKHWHNLSRTLTILDKYKGLISWSGTAFEYLMPNINIPKYPGGIISESSLFAIMSQIKYARKLNIPWGISEAAFNLRDLNNNYQYKAFGIPWLGLKRGLADEMVVSAYGTFLAINDAPRDTIQNIKRLEKEGMYAQYGFYESIDYTLNRLRKNERSAVVKTYMAHHQGLILLSLNNLFNNNVLQKRFMQNPEMQAVEILLEERMPENVIITKEQKEKVEKIKNVDYETYSLREFGKPYDKINSINVIANEDYSIMIDQRGNGYSKYRDIVVNRFKKTDDEQQGVFFFFKNIKTKRIWASGQMNYMASADKYGVYFTPDMSKFVRQDGGIETTTKVFVTPDNPVEIRRVELKNLGNSEEIIEVNSYIEPILCSFEQDYSHKAFNNLFLSTEYLEEQNTVIVKRKAREASKKDMYMAVSLYTESETMGELEYELDKERFVGRQNVELPITVENSMPLGKKQSQSLDTVVAMRRTIKIMPGQKAVLDLIISVSEQRDEAIKFVSENMNSEKIVRSMNLAKAKVEAEAMYLGVKAKEIEEYQKMLGYLILQNPLKLLMYKGKVPEEAPQSELWKYGISGDLPILLIKIKDVSDITVVKDSLKAYEFFRVKNINIDLVILNEEKKTYDNYLYDEIQNAILDRNLGYMQNVNGGIFVLNNLEKNSKRIVEYRANLLINAHLGSIARQLKDFEEEYIEKIKEIGNEVLTQQLIEEQVEKKDLEQDKLKYYNEYGGFSEDGTEYIIRTNRGERLPTVWSNIMANERFGTVVTEGMGGYTWYKNSRLNRITAWNNSQVTDVPSELIYLENMETKRVWSPTINPAPDNSDYYVIYGFGYSKYLHISDGIFQTLEVFVPKEDSAKVQILHLENKMAKKKKIKILYCIKPVLGEDEIKTNGYIDLKFNENMNLITLQSQTQNIKNRIIAYITCSEKITSYTGNKDFFIGKGTIKNPEGLRKLELDRENSLGKNEMVAIEMKIELDSFESKDVVITLGAGDEQLDIQDTAYKYTNVNNAINEYENTKRYWRDLLGTIKVSTPLESMNIMLNGWLLYQTLCSRLYARSGYYQSGGAFGFRDQLQDCIGLKYISQEFLRNQILKHSEHQFVEGDVEHWWHEETARGIRTRFSDDLLWLPYMVIEYIKYTGKYDILYEEAYYVKGAPLEENVDERYELYLPSEKKESILEHCIRAIDKSLNFGENGLPKIGSGDWNDGFSTVGNKGRGESVWLGFFQYTVLKGFILILEKIKEVLMGKVKLETGNNSESLELKIEKISEKINIYNNITEKLKRALNTNGWDGRWYRRAFMDDGNVLRKYKE